jgi:hypothetical protein
MKIRLLDASYRMATARNEKACSNRYQLILLCVTLITDANREVAIIIHDRPGVLFTRLDESAGFVHKPVNTPQNRIVRLSPIKGVCKTIDLSFRARKVKKKTYDSW